MCTVSFQCFLTFIHISGTQYLQVQAQILALDQK